MEKLWPEIAPSVSHQREADEVGCPEDRPDGMWDGWLDMTRVLSLAPGRWWTTRPSASERGGTGMRRGKGPARRFKGGVTDPVGPGSPKCALPNRSLGRLGASEDSYTPATFATGQPAAARWPHPKEAQEVAIIAHALASDKSVSQATGCWE